MEEIAVWGFRWAPPFAQGLVRDLRVRWGLREAGLPYHSRLVAIQDRLLPEYKQISPFGTVPVLEADGRPLIESGAILYALGRKSAALMPQDEREREETIAWMFAALSTVEPPILELFAIDQIYSAQEWAKQRRSSAVEAVQRRLGELAEALGERAFLSGRFTAADILMTTALRFLRHTDLISSIPPLAAYVARCEERPAFREAVAEQMSEYELNSPAAAS